MLSQADENKELDPSPDAQNKEPPVDIQKPNPIEPPLIDPRQSISQSEHFGFSESDTPPAGQNGVLPHDDPKPDIEGSQESKLHDDGSNKYQTLGSTDKQNPLRSNSNDMMSGVGHDIQEKPIEEIRSGEEPEEEPGDQEIHFEIGEAQDPRDE